MSRQYRFLLVNAPGAEISGIPLDVAEMLIAGDTLTIQGGEGGELKRDRTFSVLAVDTTDPTTTVIWVANP